MEQVSDEFLAIVVEVRDTLQGIEAVLHELYANEFLDTEMRKQLEAAEQVYDRIADDIPRAEVVLLDKWNQIEHGVDRNSVRTIWNDRYKFPNSEPPLAAPIPAICGRHPRVPDTEGHEEIADSVGHSGWCRYVSKIQQLESSQKDLQNSVWGLLRDGRDHLQLIGVQREMIMTMVHEANSVHEQIGECQVSCEPNSLLIATLSPVCHRMHRLSTHTLFAAGMGG